MGDCNGLELDTNGGSFILDHEGIVGNLGNDQIANQIFLLDWFRLHADANMTFEKWGSKRNAQAQLGSNFSEQISEFLAQVKQLIQNSMQSTASLEEVEEKQLHESMRSSEISEKQQQENMEKIESVEELKLEKMLGVDHNKELKQGRTIDLQNGESEQDNKESLEQPEEVNPGITMDSQSMNSDKIRRINSKIIALKLTALRLSAFDQREVVMPLLKSFIQARLESKVEEAARPGEDRSMEELMGEIDDEVINEFGTAKEPGSDVEKSEESLTIEADELARKSTKEKMQGSSQF